MCDRPSMYLTSSGWVLDGTTGCLKDPSSILAFCNKVRFLTSYTVHSFKYLRTYHMRKIYFECLVITIQSLIRVADVQQTFKTTNIEGSFL